jgi:hypothetical protein
MLGAATIGGSRTPVTGRQGRRPSSRLWAHIRTLGLQKPGRPDAIPAWRFAEGFLWFFHMRQKRCTLPGGQAVYLRVRPRRLVTRAAAAFGWLAGGVVVAEMQSMLQQEMADRPSM